MSTRSRTRRHIDRRTTQCGNSAEILEVRSLLSATLVEKSESGLYQLEVTPFGADPETANVTSLLIEQQPNSDWLEMGMWLYTSNEGQMYPRGPMITYSMGRRRITESFDPAVHSSSPIEGFQHLTVLSVRPANSSEVAERQAVEEAKKRAIEEAEAARVPTQEEINERAEEALRERFTNYRGQMSVADYPWLLDMPEDVPNLRLDYEHGPNVYGFDWSSIDNSEFDWSRFENTPWNPFGGVRFHPADAEPELSPDVRLNKDPEPPKNVDPPVDNTRDRPDDTGPPPADSDPPPVYDHPQPSPNGSGTPVDRSDDQNQKPGDTDEGVTAEDTGTGRDRTGGEKEESSEVAQPKKAPSESDQLTPADFVGVSVSYQRPASLNPDGSRMTRRERQEQAIMLEKLYMEERLAAWLDSLGTNNAEEGDEGEKSESADQGNSSVSAIPTDGDGGPSGSLFPDVTRPLHLSVTPFDLG